MVNKRFSADAKPAFDLPWEVGASNANNEIEANDRCFIFY